MNAPTSRPWLAACAALMLALTLAACDSLTGTDPQADDADGELAAMSDLLGQELSLSSSQQQSLDQSMQRHEHRRNEPGFLWYLAAELQTALTAEQKEQLFALAARRAAQDTLRRPGSGPGDHGPGAGPAHGDGGHDDALDDLLTDEQRTAIRAIRARYADEIRALREQRRNGAIDDAALRTGLARLHAAQQAEIDALLTDEQRAALDEARAARRAEREAERAAHAAAELAAMADALGLTEAQQSGVAALAAEQQAQHEAIREQVEAGTLTREAAAEALAALHAARLAALEGLFDDSQFEVVRIHDALRFVRAHAGGGPGGVGPDGSEGRRPGRRNG